jgi:predicted neutral ceramidase superfamily lipid hydrolase
LQEESVSSMYGRLFRLPRLWGIIVLGMCSIGLLDILFVSAYSLLFTESIHSFSVLSVLLFGYLFLFGSFLLSAAFSARLFLHTISGVMNLRRTLGVSLFSLVFTTVIFLVGWFLFTLFSLPYLDDFAILALAAGFIVRLLVDSVMLPGHLAYTISDSLSQPFLNSILLLWLLGVPWFLGFLLPFLFVICVFAVSTLLYVRTVGLQLKKLTGVDGRSFFSSFLSEWGAGRGEELERIIEKNSVRRDLKVATLQFGTLGGKMKLIIVVPTIHPGPFRGVGSSDLPDYLMRKLENDFGCPVVCAHGPSTHGENLARSEECEDVYKQLVHAIKECRTYDRSTSFSRVTKAGISVACQVFGDFALLVGSGSSSVPMDDISLKTGEAAASAAETFTKRAFFVDSHSSIDPSSDYVWPGSRIGETIVNLSREVAERASSLAKSPFKLGVSKVRSTGISVPEGMGREGVTAIIMQTAEQRIAYIFFDSNNLLYNIKPMIAKDLMKSGFNEVEILTSDTHSTSALSPGKMGYNPLGFSTSYDEIRRIVSAAVKSAETTLGDARICAGIHTIRNLRVAGEENMQNILTGTRNSLKVARNLAPVAFGLAAIISVIAVFLL